MQVFAKIDAFGCCKSIVQSDDPLWISIASKSPQYVKLTPDQIPSDVIGKYYDGKDWLHTDEVIDTRFKILAV